KRKSDRQMEKACGHKICCAGQVASDNRHSGKKDPARGGAESWEEHRKGSDAAQTRLGNEVPAYWLRRAASTEIIDGVTACRPAREMVGAFTSWQRNLATDKASC